MYTLFIDTHQNTNLSIFKNKLVLKSLSSNELRQSTIIMPLLNQLFVETNISINDIEEIIVVNGPGSFTGVRLGVTIAKTIAYMLNISIKTITSLELKAIMDDFKNDFYGIKDTKGIYVGKVKEKSLELMYKKSSEVDETNIITDVTYDFKKLINYKDNLKNINPHLVNPIYVKKIEAQK